MIWDFSYNMIQRCKEKEEDTVNYKIKGIWAFLEGVFTALMYFSVRS